MVGILFLMEPVTPIMYAKYARVNVRMFMLRGNFERGPLLVNVRLLHIIFGFVVEFLLSSGNDTPMDIVMKQLRSNMPRKIIPFMSELKRADSAKKLIRINGANLNPIYMIDCTFKTFIILQSKILYKYSIFIRY